MPYVLLLSTEQKKPYFKTKEKIFFKEHKNCEFTSDQKNVIKSFNSKNDKKKGLIFGKFLYEIYDNF
jgi:hypothetical protein